jgi:hypothetical protein
MINEESPQVLFANTTFLKKYIDEYRTAFG